MSAFNTPIYAVVVTYQPEESALLPLLKILSEQVTHTVIVDNTPKDDDRLITQLLRAQINLDLCSVLRLGENLGIAAALNIGIHIAISEGASFVLLSDQDSLPALDMVPKLLAAYRDRSSQGYKVGAVGPTFTNRQTHRTHYFRTQIPGDFFYKHRYTSVEEPFMDALTLITSGTLIPISALQDIGFMREDFFIDHVDTEWSHRARAFGYRLFGSHWARMEQRLGDDQFKVWLFHWRYESVYSPLRIYYRVRNYAALCHLKHINWRMKLLGSWYLLGIIYMHVIFGRQRAITLGMALRGAWHGLTGRMGKY
ncbi:MAG: glycosyltransferase family 2 protein [Halothiobacillus sp.]